MTSKRQVIRLQRRWAKAHGLAVDDRGYLDDFEANLRMPLSELALDAFNAGRGSELIGQKARPAKMRALHSSAALAVNAFDHWTPEDAAPLLRALGINGTLSAAPRFEARFPTGLPGTPPNLDVALELTSGTVVGIESKFTEWMTARRATRPAFRSKYFEHGNKLWERNGLAGCQRLAEELMAGDVSFRYLGAPQLLKHALGLSTQYRGQFSLFYIYYDVPCPAGEAHTEEVRRFDQLVGSELSFKSASYQDVYQRFAAHPDVDQNYLQYLGERYFPDAAEPPAP